MAKPKHNRCYSRPDNHLLGQLCEAIVIEYYLRKGCYIMVPLSHQGPADLCIIDPSDASVLLLDVKSDKWRVNTKRRTPSRIYRPRSPLQKKLDVRMAYTNADTRDIKILPPL